MVFGAVNENIANSYPNQGLTLENWTNNSIGSGLPDKMLDADISEIMIFNKALSYEELSRLSKLSPLECKALFR